MKAFAAVTRATVRQLLGGRRTVLLGLLALVPAVVALFLVADTGEAVAMRRFHDAPFALTFILVLPVVSLVLGAAALGDERRDATITVLVLRPHARETLVGAKLLGAWLAAMAIVGTGAAAAGAALGIGAGRWDVLAPLVLAVAVSGLGYVSAFLLLGYLTQRAVLIGLIYVFVWENALSFAVDGLATVSLFRLGITGYAALVDGAPRLLADVLGTLEPGVAGAVAKAAVIAVVAVLVGARWLRRRDIA
ncbi:MAG: ABC transporter permease [Acidimicrobiia bacterium]|nr:ABC transporter permease [Acidimicrobiia bacterium]